MDNEAQLDRLTGCNLLRRIGGGPTDDVLHVISTIDCIAEFHAFMNIFLITYNRLEQVGFSRFLALTRLMKLGTNISKSRNDQVQEPHALSKVLCHSDSRKRVLFQKFSRTLINANASHRT